MGQTVIAGVSVDLNDEGYLNDPSQWNEDIAAEIAKEEERKKSIKQVRERAEKIAGELGVSVRDVSEE